VDVVIGPELQAVAPVVLENTAVTSCVQVPCVVWTSYAVAPIARFEPPRRKVNVSLPPVVIGAHAIAMTSPSVFRLADARVVNVLPRESVTVREELAGPLYRVTTSTFPAVTGLAVARVPANAELAWLCTTDGAVPPPEDAARAPPCCGIVYWGRSRMRLHARAFNMATSRSR
jgi:hypothetical protein